MKVVENKNKSVEAAETKSRWKANRYS
jgi:hypothetical protein